MGLQANGEAFPKFHTTEEFRVANAEKGKLGKASGNQKCSFCGTNFQDPKSLNRHAFLHMVNPPHKCERCGKFLFPKRRPGPSQMLHLPKCGIVFFSFADFRKHCLTNPAKMCVHHRIYSIIKYKSNLML